MMWIEYYQGAFEWELYQIYKGTEEQMVKRKIEDWGDEELTYETLMDSNYQDEHEFRLEEMSESSIINLK